ncbi:MAG: alpha/beta hydrolase domain-containing protein, partial [Solirubrobacteraceae bacterium]
FVFTGLAPTAAQLPTTGPLPGLTKGQTNLFAFGLTPLALARDGDGNAIGGLGLPVITVPIASYNGGLCLLFGTSAPFPPAKLKQLYPTHGGYVAKMASATKTAVRKRYMTERDGIDLLRRACGSAIPAWATTPADRQPAVCDRLRSFFAAPAVRRRRRPVIGRRRGAGGTRSP